MKGFREALDAFVSVALGSLVVLAVLAVLGAYAAGLLWAANSGEIWPVALLLSPLALVFIPALAAVGRLVRGR